MKNPNALEKAIRFGCGAFVGLAMGFSLALNWVGFDWLGYGGAIFIIVLLGHVAICGWLATRYGDRYWDRLKDWIWMW